MEGFFIFRGFFRIVMDWLKGAERSPATAIEHRQYGPEFKSPGDGLAPGQLKTIMRGSTADASPTIAAALRSAGNTTSIQGGETVLFNGTPLPPVASRSTHNTRHNR